MGKQIKCPACKGELFRIFETVYSKDLIDFKHYELVCAYCKRGFVVKKSPQPTLNKFRK